MKTRTDWRSRAVPLCIVLTTVLSGCDKLVPAAQSDTMSLLRAGSEKACVASDVQNSLNTLIMPKAENVDGDGTTEDKRNAIAGIMLSYDMTTLQTFDAAVTRASCDTTVTVHSADGKSNKFSVNYQVSPSAENAASMIVTANAGETKEYIQGLINASLEEAAAQHQSEQQAIDEAQTRATLLATVTPKWLVGSWIDAGKESSACADGSAMAFQANHAVEGGLMTGRWVLNGDTLHVVAHSPTETFDQTWTITEADALSFQYEGTSSGSYRRCTREEMTAPVEAAVTQ